MKMKRRLVSIVLMLVLLFSLSIGVFATLDGGTTRPTVTSNSVYKGPAIQ